MGEIRVIKLPWVKKGEPIEVGPGRFTPNDYRQALIAKAAVMKEILTGIDGLPAKEQEELRAEARVAAKVAQMDALVYGLLSRADPAVKELGPNGVREKLTLEEYTAIAAAVGDSAKAPADGRPLAKAPS